MSKWVNYKGRKCCKCDKDLSTIKEHGRRYYDKNGNWNRKSFICGACYKDPLWRSGRLNPDTPTGKGFIGTQTVAKTIGADDCNIKMNNFNFYIDLSKCFGYGYSEVKTRTFNKKYQLWEFTSIEREYDTLFLVCMDEYWPWKNVERLYAIPWECVRGLKSISIYKNPLIKSEWEEFRIDEKPFNDTYHNMKLENCSVLRKDK